MVSGVTIADMDSYRFVCRYVTMLTAKGLEVYSLLKRFHISSSPRVNTRLWGIKIKKCIEANKSIGRTRHVGAFKVIRLERKFIRFFNPRSPTCGSIR